MQQLKRGMLGRYDIPDRAPRQTEAVQFGMGPRMLGLVDRLIDDADLGMGIACVQSDDSGFARMLNDQDGMFTVLVRGDLNDREVRREQVVQSIVRTVDPGADFEALKALAREPALALGLIDAESDAFAAELGLAARLLVERWQAGLGGLRFICIGESVGCAAAVREGLDRIARAWRAEEEFCRWLAEECAFYPALADCLVFRAEAAEAARLCAEMNYADGMIHIAEPFGEQTIQAPADFRSLFPLDRAGGVRFVDDLAPALLRKHRIFDAGLFVMAAPGYLAGCDTLRDCMKREDIRAFVGRAFYDEIIPCAPFSREEMTPWVISTFERFENPLNDNRILSATDHLLRRFRRGVLPAVRAWAEAHFEAPPFLGHALAAAIMLYAGARPGEDGRYQVARGDQVHTIIDDPEVLRAFARLSHDMPAESLTYAALADRTLWDGQDLREIDGLESRVMFSIAAIQQGRPLLDA